MSKSFQDLPLYPFQAVKSDQLNENLSRVINEYNGNLGSNNMPVNSLTNANFKSGTGTSITSSGSHFVDWKGQTQDYHRVKRWNVAEAGLNLWEPVETITLNLTNWAKNWNPLNNYGSFSSTYLDFETKEGMLVGCAIIDFQHGVTRITYDSDGTPFTIFYGGEWWSEWAVFVNDTMVAQTGFIYPRRETINIPFKIGVGSGSVKVDVRWRTITTDAVATGYIGDPTTPFDIYGAEIWVRNNYR